MIALATVFFEIPARTPDTASYMTAAYLVIGAFLAAYTLSLWFRWKKTKEE